MNVTVIQADDSPEEQVARAARGCYMEKFPATMSMEEVMEGYVRARDVPTQERIEHFIGGLLDRGHFGPFEHVSITFGIEGVSRVTMAQLTRHRLATFDVQSLRYTVPGEGVKITIDNIQDYIVMPPSIMDQESFMEDCVRSFNAYQEQIESLVEDGMPRKKAVEDARFLLPMATKVNITMTVNARMLMHIADMRAAGDAQWEVRDMTGEILEEAEAWFPACFKHYNEEMKGRKNRLAP